MDADSAVAEIRIFVKTGTRFKDLTGQVFGRLTVVSLAPYYICPNGRTVIRWNCICDCGKPANIPVQTSALKSGTTKSCGCWNREVKLIRQTTHGHAARKHTSKIYSVHNAMIQRCRNPKASRYDSYGGRGITVCARWKGKQGFENFLADMGEPAPEMSIERINNDGNYEPSNCRWATRKQQARNKRQNRKLTIDGEILCLKEWSERSEIAYLTLCGRLGRGWDAKRAVFEPVTCKPR